MSFDDVDVCYSLNGKCLNSIKHDVIYELLCGFSYSKQDVESCLGDLLPKSNKRKVK